MGEIGVPAEFQEEVKKYKNFWSSGNLGKFNALKLQSFSNDSIDLGIMCVLAGVRVLSLEELTKSVFLGGFEDNALLRKMEHYKIDSVFWRMVENAYGYKEYKPTLKDVIEDYSEKTYQVDTHYRKFYYYLDRLGL